MRGSWYTSGTYAAAITPFIFGRERLHSMLEMLPVSLISCALLKLGQIGRTQPGGQMVRSPRFFVPNPAFILAWRTVDHEKGLSTAYN